MSRGPLSLAELENLVACGDIDTVVVAFSDGFGRLMGKRVTGHYFLDAIAQGGMDACDYLLTFDPEMNPLPGFAFTSWEKGYGDLHAKPDLGTLRRAGWLSGAAIVLCDLSTEDGTPIDVSPRQVLIAQLERASARGYDVMMGSELEFYLYRQSYDAARQQGYSRLDPTSDYIIDYHIFGTARDEDLVGGIRSALEASAIPVEFSKGEWGCGQHEINLRYADALEMADRHVIYKNLAKELALQHGRALTFMAKPSTETAGSSCHIHTSLVDSEGRSAFWRDGAPSQVFEHFLAGQLHLARDLALFFAPTVNAYKRFQSGSFAPTRIAWGTDNRTCGFRVVGHGEAYRFENRIPGADANPYLAFAACIAAGLYGLDHKLALPEPVEASAYARQDLAQIPMSLADSAGTLQGSQAAREFLGDAVVEHYARLGILEQQAYDAAVTSWELERYFEHM